MRAFIAAIAATLLLSGCASKVPPIPGAASPEASAKWVPSRQESKAWKSLVFRTEVKQVAADRLVIDAWGRPGKPIDSIEIRLLARAAAEAQRLGFSHFAIVQIQDRNLPKAGGLMPSLGLSAEPVWIGSYEELVYNRFEREQAAPLKTLVVPGLEAVVVLLGEDHRKISRSFDAAQTFDLLGRTGVAN